MGQNFAMTEMAFTCESFIILPSSCLFLLSFFLAASPSSSSSLREGFFFGFSSILSKKIKNFRVFFFSLQVFQFCFGRSVGCLAQFSNTFTNTVVRLLQKYDRLEYRGDWHAQYHKAEIVGAPGHGVPVAFFEAQEGDVA